MQVVFSASGVLCMNFIMPNDYDDDGADDNDDISKIERKNIYGKSGKGLAVE